MEFTIKSKNKYYATVEYDSKEKKLKLIDGTDEAKLEMPARLLEPPARLKDIFSVYDPRDNQIHETRNPADAIMAYLCLSQAITGLKATISYKGELADESIEIPDEQNHIY